jgi:hypothetical protein
VVTLDQDRIRPRRVSREPIPTPAAPYIPEGRLQAALRLPMAPARSPSSARVRRFSAT